MAFNFVDAFGIFLLGYRTSTTITIILQLHLI